MEATIVLLEFSPDGHGLRRRSVWAGGGATQAWDDCRGASSRAQERACREVRRGKVGRRSTAHKRNELSVARLEMMSDSRFSCT